MHTHRTKFSHRTDHDMLPSITHHFEPYSSPMILCSIAAFHARRKLVILRPIIVQKILFLFDKSFRTCPAKVYYALMIKENRFLGAILYPKERCSSCSFARRPQPIFSIHALNSLRLFSCINRFDIHTLSMWVLIFFQIPAYHNRWPDSGSPDLHGRSTASIMPDDRQDFNNWFLFQRK